ncbi:MAG: DUF4190 domain-containing protein [Propionibacteriaceae bacterium]|nr:DUF4190 domain-containing protein [Propionibacteriaceae bacterium]
MTNPFARPDQPDPDETIPLVPDSGYADQPSPWSSGYESTAIDPLAGDTPASPARYTNPVISSPGGYANPVIPAPTGSSPYPPAPTPPAPAPSPLSLPPTAPALPDYAPAPTAPAYEQPPAAYGSGPFEPARDGSAQLAPAYSYVYSPQQTEHPNAVPTLVLGVLGFVVGITFPIAWYLGARGNAEVRREPQRYRSSGMMTVGMVLGIIGTVFMVLGVLAMVLFVVAVVAMGA